MQQIIFVKPYLEAHLLEVKGKYVTEDIDIVLGQFGPRVVVTLEEGKVSLPKRFIKLSLALEVVQLKKTVQEKLAYLMCKSLVGNTTNLEFIK